MTKILKINNLSTLFFIIFFRFQITKKNAYLCLIYKLTRTDLPACNLVQKMLKI